MIGEFDKFDRKRVWIGSFKEAEENDRRFWRAQSAFKRLRALEHLRAWIHGYGRGRPAPRFKRVLRRAKFGED